MSRAARLAALGDPIRLAIVWLIAAFGAARPLVSCAILVLRSGTLAAWRRSRTAGSKSSAAGAFACAIASRRAAAPVGVEAIKNLVGFRIWTSGVNGQMK